MIEALEHSRFLYVNKLVYQEIDISYDSREVLLDLNSEGHCNYEPCGAIRIGQWKFIRGGNMGIEDENVELNEMLIVDGRVQWGRYLL